MNKRRGAAVLIVAAVLACVFWLRGPDLDADFRGDYVKNLEILTGETTVPPELQFQEAYPLRIRFEPPISLPVGTTHAAYLTVLGPKGYGAESIDAIEAVIQPPDLGRHSPKLALKRGSVVQDLTPAPPAKSDPFVQYFALLLPRNFVNSPRGDAPLELQLWLYPMPPGRGSELGEGVLVYRHPFRIVGRPATEE